MLSASLVEQSKHTAPRQVLYHDDERTHPHVVVLTPQIQTQELATALVQALLNDQEVRALKAEP